MYKNLELRIDIRFSAIYILWTFCSIDSVQFFLYCSLLSCTASLCFLLASHLFNGSWLYKLYQLFQSCSKSNKKRCDDNQCSVLQQNIVSDVYSKSTIAMVHTDPHADLENTLIYLQQANSGNAVRIRKDPPILYPATHLTDTAPSNKVQRSGNQQRRIVGSTVDTIKCSHY